MAQGPGGDSLKSPAGARPLSARKKAVFAVITLAFPLLLFAIVELSLRVADYGAYARAFDAPEVYGGRYLVPAERLASRYFPRERFPPSPPRDPFLAVKPEKALRLFVLGESSAAGFPYPRNGTFSRVLRDALGDVLPGYTVEVVNLGMAATNSYTIADLARDVIAQKPDAVLIYGGHNEYYGALGAGSTETLGAVPAFVRSYLRLQRLRTFVLLRNAVSAATGALRGGRSSADLESDATRMEGVVGDQRIVLGGSVYRRGVRQYESNLRSAISAFRKAGVPVFLASVPSNLRDQAPFGPAAVPPDSSATIVFDSAKAVLASGDSMRAAQLFERARDLDVIRFRAPGELRAAAERIAKESGSTYVPAVERMAEASQHGIPGGDLFLEHVHPNQRGYILLAQVFYDALKSARFLGFPADSGQHRGWDEYQRRMRLTELDHRIAHHTVVTVTTRWPFLPLNRQLDYRDSYRPVDFLDSLAFEVSRGAIAWAQAKGMAGERYAASGDAARAVAEFDGLIRDAPQVELAYSAAARALMASSAPERAVPYLEKALELKPSAFAAYALAMLRKRSGDTAQAVRLLERALALSPDMPPVLYELSVIRAQQRDADGARAYALRLARVSPRFPGLREWMNALGLQ